MIFLRINCLQSTVFISKSSASQSFLTFVKHSQWFTVRRKFKRAGDRCLGQKIQILDRTFVCDEWTNVPDKVVDLIGRNLYLTPGNPIYLISQSLRKHFASFNCYTYQDPVVDLWSNFDSILVPTGHISRSRTDTFYVDQNHVLRSHTSAHQSECFRQLTESNSKFMIIGDVYRRDEVNCTHHAAFHQCELAQIYSKNHPSMVSENIEGLFDCSRIVRSISCQEGLSQDAVTVVEKELKSQIESYIRKLFGDELQTRWIDAVFPFTHPSWELEIKLPHKQNDNNGRSDEWLELLGCGIIEQKILNRDGQSSCIGWAAGIGLERLAMLFYSIPDIRLFWTKDTGFLVQFEQLVPFEPFEYRPISSYPQKVFDISFWLPLEGQPEDKWSPNDVHAIILEIGGDLVEQVHLVDQWSRPKDGLLSNTYRIVYRSHERALTNHEVNKVHEQIEQALVQQLKVQIR